MVVKTVTCSKCGNASCAIATSISLESVTWVEDNIINHVCPSCKLKQARIELPNACLAHSIPIFYDEYCPACIIAAIKSELGDNNFSNLVEAIRADAL